MDKKAGFGSMPSAAVIADPRDLQALQLLQKQQAAKHASRLDALSPSSIDSRDMVSPTKKVTAAAESIFDTLLRYLSAKAGKLKDMPIVKDIDATRM